MTILAQHVLNLQARDLEKKYGDLLLDIKANTLSHEQQELLLELAMGRLRQELDALK